MNKIRPPYQIMLLAAIVLAVFSPTIFAEVNFVDDQANLEMWFNTPPSFKEIFCPRSLQGGYYRPIIGLSFWVDRFAWFLSTPIMHLENMFFHLINVLLVFCLIRRYLPPPECRTSAAPFLGGLLFALHPLVTESVNWLSGRTDLLACIFVLASAICLSVWRERRGTYLLLLASVLAFLGILAKEAALGFLVGAPLLMIRASESGDIEGQDFHVLLHLNSRKQLVVAGACLIVSFYSALCFFTFWPSIIISCGLLMYLLHSNLELHRKWSKRDILKIGVIGAGTVAFAIGCFYTLRHLAFATDIPRISQTITLIGKDVDYAIGLFLGAVAFYVKKFFMPLPLNFAIREIDPFYGLLGVVMPFVLVMLFLRKSRPALLFLVGVALLLPALPFAFGTIAWTAYAERYAYISTAFWCAAMALASNTWKGTRTGKVGIAVLLVCISAVTLHRNLIWQKNLTLLADTVEKSPRFREARGLYMAALANAQDFKGAHEQYNAVKALPSTGYDDRYDLNFAGILFAEGRRGEAFQLIDAVLKKTRGKSENALRVRASLMQDDLMFKRQIDISKTREQLIADYSSLYKITNKPFYLYRMAQIYLSQGDKKMARQYFSLAASLLPKESPEQLAASKLSQTIVK
jgi:tetratricopeptide (TPR) repeat protein